MFSCLLQVAFIKARFNNYLNKKQLTGFDAVKYYYKEIDKEIIFYNDFDNIWTSLLCFVMLFVNGGNMKALLYLFGVTYNTFIKYVRRGGGLVLFFYQSWFCSSNYWTKQRLMDSIIEEYTIIKGVS